VPALMTAFQPINPTGEFPYFGYDGPPPEPLFNRISLDPLFNRLSYVIQAAQQSYYDFPRDRMRAKLLGLRSASAAASPATPAASRYRRCTPIRPPFRRGPVTGPSRHRHRFLAARGHYRVEPDAGV
jgi:hypothetical protein